MPEHRICTTALQPFLDDQPSAFPEGSANRLKQLEYVGKLGVVAEGVLADLLLVNGDPLQVRFSGVA